MDEAVLGSPCGQIREFRFAPLAGWRREPVSAQGTSMADALAALSVAHGGLIEGLNLNGLALDELVLTDTVIRHCSFDGASLRDLHIRRCLFQDVSLVGTDLSSAGCQYRRRSEFHDVKFLRVSAHNANFSCTRFDGCSFAASQFLHCDFYGAVIQLCDMLSSAGGSDFSGSLFDYAALRGTVVVDADLRRTSWRHARVLSAKCGPGRKDSILHAADLRAARFHRTTFCLARGSSSLDLCGTDASGLRLLAPEGSWPSDVMLKSDAGTRTSVGCIAATIRLLASRLSARKDWSEGYTALRMAELEADWMSRKPAEG